MSEEATGNVEVYNQQEIDYEDVILRRSDPDDFEQIINLVEFDDIYNRFYSFPKILKLVETAYLSITVLNQEGNIIAFATFEDFPQGMKGTYDDLHYNYWESWFSEAFQVSEFSSSNTLWMTYFITAQSIEREDQGKIFKKVLQTVYTSLPEVLGVLFLMKGDAEEDDITHCFAPLADYFEEINCRNREILKQVRGVHYNSKVFFSSRLLVLPFVEIRVAKQEDHDDLAAVFNSQSDTITEIYGDYFLAELIAAQDDTNKALVAQVKDKAIGLMGLTSDLDVKLLHECFELSPYDNLFKSEFMDAINKRREHLIADQGKLENQKREEELRRLKEETMKCNIIAQRISFQEHCIRKETEIRDEIEAMLKNEEEIKNLTRSDVEEKFDEWFAEFDLPQPSEYFFDNPTDDSDLCTNIQTKKDFALSCLEIFDLPPRYMAGNGHFPDWGKEKNEKAGANLLRGMQKKKQNKSKQIQKKFKNRIKDADKEEKVKPTHFDLEPFLKAFKEFVTLNSEVRSKIRLEMKKESDVIDSIFVDKYGERSYKQCVDIMSLEKILLNRQVPLHQQPNGTIGKLLRCFGQLDYQLKEVIKMPEKDPKEVAKEAARKKAEEEAKLKEEQEGTKGKDKRNRAPSLDEDSDELKKKAPPLPIRVKLYETSIHDMYQAINKMQDYDFTLEELGVVANNLDEERIKEGLKPKHEHESELDVSGDEQDNHMGKPNRKAEDEEIVYSDDPQYNEVVKHINDLETIPEPPEKAKNAFAITLFCIEVAFDSRSRDFLKYAFDLYPDRDYLILTQPHTVPESTLLQKFTLVDKKAHNTFHHVLYIIHRDSLLDTETCIRRAVVDDIEDINALTTGLDNEKVINDDVYNSLVSPDSKYQTFVAKIANTVTGVFVTSKDVNLNYYKSHFHIQDSILLPEHDRRGHTRLWHSVVNPVYERNTRYCLKEILRLAAKTCLYFEISSLTVIPQIFNELINVRTRRFPHFLKQKWDHERNVYEDEEENKDGMDGAERDYLDEEEAPFALCFITRRLLSEPKIVKNSRIVVIGSSDTGISFIEALLSISYLRFTNIVLISPGGLPHHHFVDHQENLKAYSTSYSNEELKRLMLENRVQVINARMVDIERQEKKVILHDGSMIPYDTLILAMGLQDQTLNVMGYSSRGIVPTPEGKQVIEGLLSIDDPLLYQHLAPNSSLIKLLNNRKKKNDVVVYGRTLNAYCCIQGLMNRGIRPHNIFLIIPEAECHLEHNYDEEDEKQDDIPFINPEAFKDSHIKEKIHNYLIELGVTIYENCLLQSIEEDDTECLKSVVFKRLDIPEEEEGEDDEDEYAEHSKNYHDGEGDEEDMSAEGEGANYMPKKKRKKNELPIDCKVLITAGHRNVDPDVFNSIHNNGLVYNGRLIVDKNFQTTDISIFAAGALCEFSGRYSSLAQGRSLRLDRYNGREMGSRLARSVFDIYDPAVSAASQEQSSLTEEELPSFFLPQGYGGKVPGNYWFYDIFTTNPLRLKPGVDSSKNRPDLMCDNIKEDGKGTLIKFTFNNIGLIDTVTYYGSEEIVVQSLWSFVGLHENYLNQLTSRFENGVIHNVVEFLSENWAIALYHEWFGDFCLRMRQGIQGRADMQEILKKVFDESQNGEGITRERMQKLKKLMDSESSKLIEDETLEFIKVNLNHLPMYFIPGDEFDYGAK